MRPLSNLDASFAWQTRRRARRAPQQRLAVTTVYVTHDQVEAMTMESRRVLRDGYLQQADTPFDALPRARRICSSPFMGSRP